MTVVVDSSVLIDHLRDHTPATRLLRDAVARDRRLVASVLTKIELRVGALERQAPALEALFALLDFHPVMEDVADLAGDYAERFSGIDPVDYVIAATTTTLGAELWTSSLRRFPMFADLRSPY